MCVIDVMIPVWKPDKRLRYCVERLLRQTCEVRSITLVFSVDDAWDGRVEEGWFSGQEKVKIERIPRSSYDHGGTRSRWASGSNADIYLFIVQDAVPADDRMVEYLSDSLKNPKNAAVYARQIPGFGCDAVEAYTRYFNYPGQSIKKTKEKLEKGGIKDCFTSNVCAAYRRGWFERIGGFEERILLSEDSIFAAKALKAGADVIYQSKARVVHAHRYGYVMQWKRNFDIGIVHKKYEDIFGSLKTEKEGILLVRKTAAYLMKYKKAYLLPRLFCLSLTKFAAYQCGKRYERLPGRVVMRWSLNEFYWRRKER